MANILQTLNNFVTITYRYVVDSVNTINHDVTVNSNTVSLNVASVGNSIKTSASIQYSYTVDPADQPKTTIVNSALVETVFGSLASLSGSSKFVSLKYADIGDNINYAVKIINNGIVEANNIVFKDTLPQGVTFVAGSVMVDGVALSDSNANPTVGFNVDSILPGMSRVVTFKVKVTSIPSTNQVGNIAEFSYDFLINPNDPNSKQTGTDTTGSAVVTVISHAELTGIQKVVDKKTATLGDILTYTTTIPNTGNVPATDVVFNEYVPSKTKLIAGSITATVDGVSVLVNGGSETDMVIKAPLGTIPAGKSAIVIFKVKITN